VDHDIFRPDLNPNGSRAMNLRYDNTDTNVTTVSGRNRDFISTEVNGGICISCHQSELNKDTYTPTLGVTTVGPIAKTDYASSSHNYEATSTFSKDNSVFYANCLKCHTREESSSYQSSTNKFALHNSNLPRLLLASEEGACYACHDGSEFYGISGKNPDNIQTLFGKTYTHPISITGKHTSYYDEYLNATAGWMSPSSGNRHAECVDCHNPHLAQAGTHTLGTSTVSNALKGTWGVEPPDTPAWQVPDQNSYTKVNPAQYEYQICFKCHSSFAYGSNPPPGQTDQAKEFNPNNASYHGVMAVPSDAYSGASYDSPWTYNSRMYCSDCHGSDDANDPEGPHGSNRDHILKGRWDEALSYTDSGKYPDNRGHGNGGYTGSLCDRCHNIGNATGFTDGKDNLHTRRHNKFSCINCHSRIPHGMNNPHLWVFGTDSAPYKDSYFQGRPSPWPHRSPGNWRENDCHDVNFGCD
jgi:hypothetical protein